jgi:hypothetical protein
MSDILPPQEREFLPDINMRERHAFEVSRRLR